MSSERQQGTSPVEQLMIRADELAELLQISVRSIWRLLSAKRIPEPVRIGGTVRWSRESVLKWISEGCPVPESRDNTRGEI